MFFELVSIIFAIVSDYGNEYTTKENKNWTSFKNFAPKLNLNHNTYIKLRPQKISGNQKFKVREKGFFFNFMWNILF